MENRSKICVCYVITALLITTLIYSLVSTHISSLARLQRLQYEVEEITKVVLGRKPPGDTLLSPIDSYVKKRTEGLWNEMTVIKKKVDRLARSESGCGVGKKAPTELSEFNEAEPSYTLDSLGAAIVEVFDEPLHPTGFLISLFGVRHKSNYPGRILEPSMQLGHCYAFRGSESIIIIRLSHMVIIQAITVEHIAAHESLSGDISNAPKDFQVFGIDYPSNEKEVLLGTFQYNNVLDDRAQKFQLTNDTPFHYCKIKVLSNHGNKNHTCIYRVGVHGKLVGK